MLLLTPGPVPVRPEILEAQNREMITHRSAEFSALYADLCSRLRQYLGADEAYVLTGSGALGLEALIVNLCSHDDTMLCLPNGEFGDKLVDTARVYIQGEVATLAGGQGWSLARARERIDASQARALAIVYNETGYGIRNHVKDICQYAKSRGLVTIVDGISAWPGTEFNMRDFGVDGFVTGSQKGIGAPPGLALIGLSATAIERLSAREFIPSYYLDLRRHRKRFLKDCQTPNTPAITLFWALQKAFDTLDHAGGVSACVNRHRNAAARVRQRLAAMGFPLVAESGFESNTVTSFICRNAEQARSIKAKLEQDYGIAIAACRGRYKDNGLRIAHMGNFRLEDLEACLAALERLARAA